VVGLQESKHASLHRDAAPDRHWHCPHRLPSVGKERAAQRLGEHPCPPCPGSPPASRREPLGKRREGGGWQDGTVPRSAARDTRKAAAAAARWLVTAGKRATPEAAGRPAAFSATWSAWPYFDDDFKISPRRGAAGRWGLVGSVEEGTGRNCGGLLGTVPKVPCHLPGVQHVARSFGLKVPKLLGTWYQPALLLARRDPAGLARPCPNDGWREAGRTQDAGTQQMHFVTWPRGVCVCWGKGWLGVWAHLLPLPASAGSLCTHRQQGPKGTAHGSLDFYPAVQTGRRQIRVSVGISSCQRHPQPLWASGGASSLQPGPPPTHGHPNAASEFGRCTFHPPLGHCSPSSFPLEQDPAGDGDARGCPPPRPCQGRIPPAGPYVAMTKLDVRGR